MKSVKKVIFNCYPSFGLDLGGLQIQIKKTAAALQELGIEVKFHNIWNDLDPSADILHCFSIDSSNYNLARRAKKYGLKVVVSPVLNAFATPIWLLKSKIIGSNIPGFYTQYKLARQLFSITDIAIALNIEESQLLQKCFGVPEDKIRIIPNGIDEKYFNANEKPFRDKYKEFGKILLQVSAIEKRKNQLNVAKAFEILKKKNELKLSYINIGPTRDSSEKYKKSIEDLNISEVHLLPPLDNSDPLLPSAYAAAEFFILPSYSEVMPLVLYEAAAAGCRLLISKNIPIEYFLDKLVIKFDPNNPESIAKAIINAEENKEEVISVRGKIITWKQVGVNILNNCYENN